MISAFNFHEQIPKTLQNLIMIGRTNGTEINKLLIFRYFRDKKLTQLYFTSVYALPLHETVKRLAVSKR